MSRARAYLELARPHHWVKNAFVFAGVLFGHAWNDPEILAAAVVTAAAFCLASSAVYAFNDCLDAEQDRDHPDKRDRPVARGAVEPREAYVLSAALGAAGLAFAAWVGLLAAAIVAAYLGLNAAYTLGLKRVPVIDVFAIASGFMLRLLAGTSGIGVEPSQWLLACGFLLTLFLGFAKRRAELARLAEDAAQHRAVLDAYTTGFLDKAIVVCAAGMIVSYALYTVSPETAALHGTGRLTLTLPWVLLGTFRYLFRLHFRGGGGDPAEEVLRDPLLAAASAGWIATVLWLIS
ncbi:MAG TPA: decaprenyl-phosphate phosphoribosyltransferase [Burkholderiales bacterium]|jgi:4-hydroxybenzoate polyprenyltransferase|nr:decaprenyl-phosphate phosphoribosyltransferase [Burkholderiales bacterium]